MTHHTLIYLLLDSAACRLAVVATDARGIVAISAVELSRELGILFCSYEKPHTKASPFTKAPYNSIPYYYKK